MNASVFNGAAAPVSAINITLHILTETVRQRGNRVVTNKLFTGYRLIPASACAPFVTAPAAWRPSPRSATALVSRGQLVAERRTRLFLIMDACKRLPATAAGSGMPVNCYRRDTPPSLHHARIDGVERAPIATLTMLAGARSWQLWLPAPSFSDGDMAGKEAKHDPLSSILLTSAALNDGKQTGRRSISARDEANCGPSTRRGTFCQSGIFGTHYQKHDHARNRCAGATSLYDRNTVEKNSRLGSQLD